MLYVGTVIGRQVKKEKSRMEMKRLVQNQVFEMMCRKPGLSSGIEND